MMAVEKKKDTAYGDYRIGLVDDDPVFLDNAAKMVKRILERNGIFCTIEAFDTASELLKVVSAGFRYDILFLDILMKDFDGLSLAEKLRCTGAACTPIVFVTATKEYALEGYRVRALHYLLKPVKEKDLEGLLLDVCRKKNEEDDAFLVVHYQRQYGKVPFEEVEYIEQIGRKVAVHTFSGELISSDTLNGMQNALPQTIFVRCHQGYAVNLQHVMLLEGTYVEMRSGRRVPVSRSHRKEMKLAFLEKMKNCRPANEFAPNA